MDAELLVLEARREQFRNAQKNYGTAKREVSVALRHYRNASKISLRTIADEVMCSVAFLSDIELGRRFPSEEVLADIVKALKSTRFTAKSKLPRTSRAISSPRTL